MDIYNVGTTDIVGKNYAIYIYNTTEGPSILYGHEASNKMVHQTAT